MRMPQFLSRSHFRAEGGLADTSGSGRCSPLLHILQRALEKGVCDNLADCGRRRNFDQRRRVSTAASRAETRWERRKHYPDCARPIRLEIPSNLSKKTPITLSKLCCKIALFRQHRDEMHHQERRHREQRNPKIVHSKTKSDHKKSNPHIHRVASEAIRPLQNQLWRGLPGNRVLACALEQNARPGNKAHAAGENENGCREAKPPGKHERQWHSLTLNNRSQNNRPQKNQRRRESNLCTVFVRNGHALTSLLGRPTEEYGLSDGQSAGASHCAIDSRVILARTNDRLHYFWRRTR